MNNKTAYISPDGLQYTLFEMKSFVETTLPTTLKNNTIHVYPREKPLTGRFQIQNRRYLGNKYKLTGFLKDIVKEKCGFFRAFCDIFAGTGVVGNCFNDHKVKIISNDNLYSNFVILKSFLGITQYSLKRLEYKINLLNDLRARESNYFSKNFGGSYFTLENAIRMGAIRNKIEEIADNENEKHISKIH